MKKTLLISLASVWMATAALASPKCDAGSQPMKTEQEVKSQLAGAGYEVGSVKKSKGCFEVRARRPDGQRVELYLDPVTLRVLKEERD